MDALITREAWLAIRSLAILRPDGPLWGFLVGRRRGPRYFVEGVLPGGQAAPGSAVRSYEETERLWPGRIVGLYAYRPDPELRRIVLGPFFYGKLFVEVRAPRSRLDVRPFAVEFDGRFLLVPVPLAPPAKNGGP